MAETKENWTDEEEEQTTTPLHTENTIAEPEIYAFDIKLVSCDGEQFVVNAKAAIISDLIKNMVNESQDGDDEDQEIPLPNVNSSVLAKVILFMQHHLEHPMDEIEKVGPLAFELRRAIHLFSPSQPMKETDLTKLVGPFFAGFICEQKTQDLFDILLAANYLDCKPLLDLGSARIASIVKTNSVEDIRKILDITNDFTPEEEAKAIEQHGWVNEL